MKINNIKNWYGKNRINILSILISLLIALLAFYIIVLEKNIDELKKENLIIKEEINKIKMDYQFLDYNKTQLEEIK